MSMSEKHNIDHWVTIMATWKSNSYQYHHGRDISLWEWHIIMGVTISLWEWHIIMGVTYHYGSDISLWEWHIIMGVTISLWEWQYHYGSDIMTGNKLSKCFHEGFMLIVVLEMLNRLKIYTSMKGFFYCDK